MYTTLEYLDKCIEKKRKKSLPKHLLKELRTILIIFAITFVWMLLFTNAQVFFSLDRGDEKTNIERTEENIQTDNTISTQVDNATKKKEELENILSQYEWNEVVQKGTTETIQNLLESKMKDYSFDFNVVPPTNRLIIWKINLDVPIVDSQYKRESDFTQWNFDSELENWVVKYPTTPAPWKMWNTLIFGHTSQEWREKNPYWTVFSKIPNLDLWDEITVIRWWNLYKYKIIEKTTVYPKNVDSQYKKYKDWDFLTLMWCYPIWRTDKRMMITAQRIN